MRHDCAMFWLLGQPCPHGPPEEEEEDDDDDDDIPPPEENVPIPRFIFPEKTRQLTSLDVVTEAQRVADMYHGAEVADAIAGKAYPTHAAVFLPDNVNDPASARGYVDGAAYFAKLVWIAAAAALGVAVVNRLGSPAARLAGFAITALIRTAPLVIETFSGPDVQATPGQGFTFRAPTFNETPENYYADVTSSLVATGDVPTVWH